MIVKELKDLNELKDWYGERGLKDFYEILPKTGFICYDDNNIPLSAGFYYLTNSSVIWLGWFVTNPKADYVLRRRGLDLIIDEIIKVGKESNYKFIFGESNNEALCKIYKRNNFLVGDKNSTQYIRRIE